MDKLRLIIVFVFAGITQGVVAIEELAVESVTDEKTVYIDVRTWVEYKVDHIDGDMRIHVSDIVSGVEMQFPDKTTLIKLYCERGVRAETARIKLSAAGYSNVVNAGGIDDVRESRFGSLVEN